MQYVVSRLGPVVSANRKRYQYYQYIDIILVEIIRLSNQFIEKPIK